MSEGNGKDRGHNPWTEDEPTADVEPGLPAIAEHADLCSQFKADAQGHRAVATALMRYYHALRLARTPILTSSILHDIADTIEQSLAESQETVALLREQARKLEAAQAGG